MSEVTTTEGSCAQVSTIIVHSSGYATCGGPHTTPLKDLKLAP